VIRAGTAGWYNSWGVLALRFDKTDARRVLLEEVERAGQERPLELVHHQECPNSAAQLHQ
jgi:hypothetical protein